MKTLLRLCACLLLGCVLTACPETTVNDDFGLKPLTLKASDWNGSWQPIDDDDKTDFSVIDAQQGLIRFTEPGKKEAMPIEFKIRRASADDKVNLYFVLIHEKGTKPGSFTIYILRQSDKGILFLWGIEHDAIEAAIKAGQLQGSTRQVKNDTINHLDSVPANYTKLLEPQFWNWSEPMVLKRAKK